MAIIGRVRRLRTLVVISAAAMALVAVSAAPAHAGIIQIHDGFEGNPASVWHVERYGNSDGGFDINAGLARSGQNNAWLTAQTDFSAVGREVVFSVTRGTTCGASIYVKPLGGVSVIHVAVIDPATWTGQRFEYTLSGSGGYQRVAFPSWQFRRTPVFLRVALIGNGRSQGILLDDLVAQCLTP